MKEISSNKVILTSLVVNIIDIVTNIIVAILTGSMVMVVEAIQGVADLISVFLVYIGYKKSQTSPSSHYPLGKGREIYFWSLLSSLFMLGVTATVSFYFGLQRFLYPEQVSNLFIAYAVLVFSILTNAYAFSLGLRKLSHTYSLRGFIAQFIKSEYIEIKTTIVSDLIGTSVAICGLFSLMMLKFTGDLRFDGIGAMTMAVILGFLSFFLILGSKSLLIGRSASRDIHQKIRISVNDYDEVVKITELKTVFIGSGKLLVLLDLHLKNGLSTDQIESLVNNIKKHIKDNVATVHEIQIELT